MSDQEIRKQADEAEKAGDKPLAIRLYSDLIQRNPADNELRLRRSALWNQVGESHLALTDLNHAIKANPKSPALYLRRAGIWLDVEKYVKADLDLGNVLSLAPEYKEARIWRAEIRLRYGNTYAAIVDLLTVLENDPFNEEALRWYAFAKGQLAGQQMSKIGKEKRMSGGEWWKAVKNPAAEAAKIQTSMDARGPLRVDVDVARWPSGARLEISIVQPSEATKNKGPKKAADKPAAAEGGKPT